MITTSRRAGYQPNRAVSMASSFIEPVDTSEVRSYYHHTHDVHDLDGVPFKKRLENPHSPLPCFPSLHTATTGTCFISRPTDNMLLLNPAPTSAATDHSEQKRFLVQESLALLGLPVARQPALLTAVPCLRRSEAGSAKPRPPLPIGCYLSKGLISLTP